jgi:hypothetical protein
MPSTSAKTTAHAIATSSAAHTGKPAIVEIANPYAPSSMKPAWPKLSRPVRPKCTLRPIAARA